MATTTLVLGLLSAALLATPAPVSAAEESPQARMLDGINEFRLAAGLPPLRAAPALERSATAFCGELMEHDHLAHRPSIHAGGRFRRLGEALSLHRGWRPAVGRTVERWLESPVHRQILMNASFTHGGAGLVHGRYRRSRATIWVLQLGG
jgi:uncharacterized protein YkwD